MNHTAPKLSTVLFTYASWTVIGLMIGSGIAYFVSGDGLQIQKWSMVAGATFACLINIQPRGVRT
jgi:hypothetical protein